MPFSLHDIISEQGRQFVETNRAVHQQLGILKEAQDFHGSKSAVLETASSDHSQRLRRCEEICVSSAGVVSDLRREFDAFRKEIEKTLEVRDTATTEHDIDDEEHDRRPDRTIVVVSAHNGVQVERSSQTSARCTRRRTARSQAPRRDQSDQSRSRARHR